MDNFFYVDTTHGRTQIRDQDDELVFDQLSSTDLAQKMAFQMNIKGGTNEHRVSQD